MQKYVKETLVEARQIISEEDFDGYDVFCGRTAAFDMQIPRRFLLNNGSHTSKCQHEIIYHCTLKEQQCQECLRISYVKDETLKRYYVQVGDFVVKEEGKTYVVSAEEFAQKFKKL